MNAHDDPQAWLQAQPTSDPVSRRVLEGLARRAARQPQGALRERLVARLVERAQAQASTPATAPRTPASGGPLAELTARLQVGAGPELRNVHLHRRTWSALRLTRRMAEVSAPVPDHLGPLNSQVLVSRALQQLRELSPDYLQRLLTQLDALAALAPLQAMGETEKTARAGERKAAAARKR